MGTVEDKMVMAEEALSRVFKIALEIGKCLEVSVWIAEGNVVIEEDGKLKFLTASDVAAKLWYEKRREGIG